jgi:hypothetical protein
MGSQRLVGCTAAIATALAFLHGNYVTNAFSNRQSCPGKLALSTRLELVPPPGSGYAGPEYEIDEMPASYEPMMEYPGTMRPGRTPENMPFHDLPIGDDDPDPVPWPHFQQIEVGWPIVWILSFRWKFVFLPNCTNPFPFFLSTSGIIDGLHRILTQYQWKSSLNNRADGTCATKMYCFSSAILLCLLHPTNSHTHTHTLTNKQ